MAITVDLMDRERLIHAATTSLNSKVVSQNANLLAPMAVEAVLRVSCVFNIFKYNLLTLLSIWY